MSERKPHQQPDVRLADDERRYRKEHLAAAFRVWARLGYDEGPAGHITVRDPERTDHFWVNPFGMHFGMIRVSDLILVNHEGEVVEGTWPVNRAAFAIHSAIHQARPDVNAAAHCHSVHGKAFSSLGRLLDPLTQDACAFYEDHALFDDYTGVVCGRRGGPAHRRRARVEQGGHPAQPRAAHRRRHASTRRPGGSSPWTARCHAQLLADAAGPTVKIDHPNAKLTHSPGGHRDRPAGSASSRCST